MADFCDFVFLFGVRSVSFSCLQAPELIVFEARDGSTIDPQFLGNLSPKTAADDLATDEAAVRRRKERRARRQKRLEAKRFKEIAQMDTLNAPLLQGIDKWVCRANRCRWRILI